MRRKDRGESEIKKGEGKKELGDAEGERERNDEADWKVKIKGYEAAARPKSRSRKRFCAASSTRREKKESHTVHGKIK